MKDKFKTSLFWNFIGSFATKIINFSVTIVLTRILFPKDFGILAIALILINILIELNRFGIESFIVYKNENNSELINSSFSFLLVISVFFSISGALITPFTARFYNTPEIIPVLLILSLSIIIYPFYWVPLATLTRDMNFKKIAMINTFSTLGNAIIVIALALNGYGIISLTLSTFLDKFIGVILFFKYTKFRPKLNFNIIYWKEIFKYGKNILGATICWLVIINLDKAITGKVIGIKELGFYSLAYKLAMTPSNFLSIIFYQVTFPIFSKLKNRIKEFKKFYFKIILILSVLALPLFLPLIFLAKPLIIAVFGEKWIVSANPFKILLVCSIINLIFSFCLAGIRAIGRTDIELKIELFLLPLSIIVFLISVQYGITGIALGISFVLSLRSLLLFYFGLKTINNKLQC